MELKFDTVDVFTRTRFTGNPLAIVHAPASQTLTQEQKQRLANEFNLSETVILHENPEDALDRKVDIFIVGAEIPFAGHPTIGTLCHIGSTVKPSSPVAIKLHVKAGLIQATYDPGTQSARASIPHEVLFHSVVSATAGGFSFPIGGSSGNDGPHAQLPYPIVSPCRGMSFMLVELPDTAALSACAPRMVAAMSADHHDKYVREIAKPTLLGTYFWTLREVKKMTAAKEGEPGVVIGLDTRMMLNGIPPEDPATGSAACTLASALSVWRRSSGPNPEAGQEAAVHRPACFEKIVSTPDGSSAGLRDRYEIVQGRDMGRESHITVEVVMKDDRNIDEVILCGQAVEVMRGSVTC